MATKALARKTHRSMVINPAPRPVTIGGRSSSRTVRKSNPVRRASSVTTNPRKRHHKRRRRNPGTLGSVMRNPGGGMIAGALTAGVGFALFDIVLQRVLPSGTPMVQAISKIGAGFLLSQFGNRIPLVGKYKDPVAFVLIALGIKGLADIYLVPTVRNTFTSLTTQASSFLNPAVVTPAATTSGVNYGGRTLARGY